MTGRHFLIVPGDLGDPMDIEHPTSCPQRGRLELVREEDGTVACLIEEAARLEEGPERFFRRPGETVPLFHPPASLVRPGRWPIWCWPDGHLRLVAPLEQANGGDAA